MKDSEPRSTKKATKKKSKEKKDFTPLFLVSCVGMFAGQGLSIVFPRPISDVLTITTISASAIIMGAYIYLQIKSGV